MERLRKGKVVAFPKKRAYLVLVAFYETQDIVWIESFSLGEALKNHRFLSPFPSHEPRRFPFEECSK